MAAGDGLSTVVQSIFVWHTLAADIGGRNHQGPAELWLKRSRPSDELWYILLNDHNNTVVSNCERRLAGSSAKYELVYAKFSHRFDDLTLDVIANSAAL